jgi:hypothetical protein
MEQTNKQTKGCYIGAKYRFYTRDALQIRQSSFNGIMPFPQNPRILSVIKPKRVCEDVK